MDPLRSVNVPRGPPGPRQGVRLRVGRLSFGSVMVPVMRGILVFGCAAAFAVAPLVVAAPAPACPYGPSERSPGLCTNGQSRGGFGQPGVGVPPQASAPGATVVLN